MHTQKATFDYDDLSLAETRDLLTAMPADSSTEDRLEDILYRSRTDVRSSKPLAEIRDLLENLRQIPRNQMRVQKLNTFVRTLGTSKNLATLLDVMLESSEQHGTSEQKLSTVSTNGVMHCVYGWSGQTILCHTSSAPTAGTLTNKRSLEGILGYPPATWSLSLHVWQPNRFAKGFQSEPHLRPGSIVEPPHSHPFDFFSKVVKGSFVQSIFRENSSVVGARPNREPVSATKVDGAWPPHMIEVATNLKEVERQVSLKAGDSYFLPNDRIHDVSVAESTARNRPTITLFLATESRSVAYAYLSRDILDFHKANPRFLRRAKALNIEAWRAKLQAISAYLQDHSKELNLDEVTKYDGEYGFFYRNQPNL